MKTLTQLQLELQEVYTYVCSNYITLRSCLWHLAHVRDFNTCSAVFATSMVTAVTGGKVFEIQA